MLCKYRHIFGEERKGFHSYRFLDVAIGDVIGTVLIALLIAYLFNFSFLNTVIVAFIVGILAHRLFCVNTKLNTIIFGEV